MWYIPEENYDFVTFRNISNNNYYGRVTNVKHTYAFEMLKQITSGTNLQAKVYINVDYSHTWRIINIFE